jgi:hypothetical protein
LDFVNTFFNFFTKKFDACGEHQAAGISEREGAEEERRKSSAI